MQLQTECSQPGGFVGVRPNRCHLNSASAGLRGSDREAAMTRRSIGLGLAAVAVFVGLFYFYGGHQTPSGRMPLADLNATNLSGLKNEFNGSAPKLRILLFL